MQVLLLIKFWTLKNTAQMQDVGLSKVVQHGEVSHTLRCAFQFLCPPASACMPCQRTGASYETGTTGPPMPCNTALSPEMRRMHALSPQMHSRWCGRDRLVHNLAVQCVVHR